MPSCWWIISSIFTRQCREHKHVQAFLVSVVASALAQVIAYLQTIPVWADLQDLSRDFRPDTVMAEHVSS